MLRANSLARTNLLDKPYTRKVSSTKFTTQNINTKKTKKSRENKCGQNSWSLSGPQIKIFDNNFSYPKTPLFSVNALTTLPRMRFRAKLLKAIPEALSNKQNPQKLPLQLHERNGNSHSNLTQQNCKQNRLVV